MTLSPWRTLQNVIHTQKCKPCQLNKPTPPFHAGGFPPDTASSTRPKAITWPQFNRHALELWQHTSLNAGYVNADTFNAYWQWTLASWRLIQRAQTPLFLLVYTDINHWDSKHWPVTTLLINTDSDALNTNPILNTDTPDTPNTNTINTFNIYGHWTSTLWSHTHKAQHCYIEHEHSEHPFWTCTLKLNTWTHTQDKRIRKPTPCYYWRLDYYILAKTKAHKLADHSPKKLQRNWSFSKETGG